MPLIRQLPPSVINKIAAGEVVERPASVVKELLENAVDAGATRIDVALEQGGLELVRIADNGVGIDSRQLPLAVASHATSKIQDADDLFRVQTLGFRGEALASIAEISHLLIRSRPADSEAGAELVVHGGQTGDVAPCGSPLGTILEIRHLFFNTPVRRKFMRSTQTELGHSTEAFTRIALAYPHVHFTLRHGERLIHELPPTDNWRERIAAFFGAEIGESLIWIESAEEAAGLRGYVANPTQSRANNRLQYLFLNGRYIRDRSLQHALSEAYRGLLLTGRFPIVFLQLELRPDVVDVNVHPTKLEVRFEDAGRIYSQLLGALRTRFLSMDLTAKVAAPAASSSAAAMRVAGREPYPVSASGLDEETIEQHRRDVTSWARGEVADASRRFELSPPGGETRQARFDFQPQRAWRPVPEFQPFPDRGGGSPQWIDSPGIPRGPPDSHQPVNHLLDPRAWPPGERDGASAVSAELGGTARAFSPGLPNADPAVVAQRSPEPTPAISGHPAGIQIDNRYLVTEAEEGLVIIDQHALHERILYEQIRNRVLGGKFETQRLLVPEPVTLLPAEAAAALEAKEALDRLGIEIEPFGGDTVLISAYPAMLANLGPQAMLRHVIELLLAGGKSPDRRDILDELLHMISCKAAVKAGDRLSLDEVRALLEQRHLFQDTHHCPHGRPTALVFTREELDRRFKRT